MTGRRVENTVLTVATLIAAATWFFPLYWAIVTSLRTDESVVAGAGLSLTSSSSTPSQARSSTPGS